MRRATRPVVVGLGEVLWDILPAGKQLGGAPANFAYHARAQGATGVVVSRVGDDALGREILARLDALGLDLRHVSVDARHPTGTVNVRLDAGGVPQYVIHESAAWDYLATGGALRELAGATDAVCFGTLAQRSAVSRGAVRDFLRATGPDCLRVFDINLRQSYYDRTVVHESLLLSDVLKLNEDEVHVLADRLELVGAREVGDVDGVVAALLDRYPLRLVALTRGGAGSLLCARDGRRSDHQGFPVANVADTVGAGDAFTAAMVMGLLRGDDLDRINAHANRLAAYVCSQHGATPAIPEELRGDAAGEPAG